MLVNNTKTYYNQNFGRITNAAAIAATVAKCARTEYEEQLRLILVNPETSDFLKQNARGGLVRMCGGLVHKISRFYMGCGLDFADMKQEGYIGALLAANKFDSRYNNTFGTYAWHRIRASIKRALSDKAHTIRVPVHAVDARAAHNRFLAAYSAEYDMLPDDEQIMKGMGISRKKLNII